MVGLRETVGLKDAVELGDIGEIRDIMLEEDFISLPHQIPEYDPLFILE